MNTFFTAATDLALKGVCMLAFASIMAYAFVGSL